MIERDEVLDEALSEGRESLERMERDLSALEGEPASRETLGSLFRTLHSIKGTWSTLGFAKVAAVAHGGEDLLGRVRDGGVEFDAEISRALLRTADCLGEMLSRVDATGCEGDDDFTDLVNQLARLGTRESPASARSRPPSSDAERTGFLASAPESRNVRVESSLLEELADVADEIRFTKERLLGFTVTRKDPALFSATRRLDLLAGRLVDLCRKARRRPIGALLETIPNSARRLAAACGKAVRVESTGLEIEVGVEVLQSLRDPLNQIVRNAIDHGIEAPDTRLRAGKPREGRIDVGARLGDGEIRIEVADDGAGIDLAKVRAKAIELRLVGADRLARMSDDEIAGLVFRPGLTTRGSVTSLSGRGVGLDVVHTRITRMGGTVEARSRRDFGTTILIRIPTVVRR